MLFQAIYQERSNKYTMHFGPFISTYTNKKCKKNKQLIFYYLLVYLNFLYIQKNKKLSTKIITFSIKNKLTFKIMQTRPCKANYHNKSFDKTILITASNLLSITHVDYRLQFHDGRVAISQRSKRQLKLLACSITCYQLCIKLAFRRFFCRWKYFLPASSCLSPRTRSTSRTARPTRPKLSPRARDSSPETWWERKPTLTFLLKVLFSVTKYTCLYLNF